MDNRMVEKATSYQRNDGNSSGSPGKGAVNRLSPSVNRDLPLDRQSTMEINQLNLKMIGKAVLPSAEG